MSGIDDLKDKGKDLMNDPDKKAQIEQMAKEKGISIDEAKKRLTKQDE